MKVDIVIIVLLFIIVVAISLIYVVIRLRQRQKIFLGLTELKKELIPVIEDEQRLGEIEKAMDKLVKDHAVLNRIEDSYSLIDLYITCKNDDEYEHCRKYLKKRYLKSFKRYDKER